MKNKIKNQDQNYDSRVFHRVHMKNFLNYTKKAFVLVSILSLLFLIFQPFHLSREVQAVGIDTVTGSIPEGSDGVGVDAQVTIEFESSVLTNGEVFTIYLGDTTAGNQWELNAVTTTDCGCSDDGAAEAYTVDSISAASATLPMRMVVTATTVGGGATKVTCLIGDAAPDPTNPSVAGIYSVAVTTSADSGAGSIYVGDANDITVSVTVMPNLSLTIDNADGTYCTTASSITTCDLGTVLTTTVGTGYYDLNVGTNAASGATISIAENQDLINGGEDIADCTEDDTIVAGSEDYGLTITKDAAWTMQGDWVDNDTPIEASEAFANTGAPIATSGDDITVTHKAAIDAAVQALVYSHTVTWTVAANF